MKMAIVDGKASSNSGCFGLLSKPYRDVYDAAIRLKQDCDAKHNMKDSDKHNHRKGEKSILWSTKYRPYLYTDLLGNETVNRTVLKWFKLWKNILSGVVKNKVSRIVNRKRSDNKTFESKLNLLLELEEHMMLPKYKILLLNGDPGIGKTMMINVIAKHLGFEIIEINASDERTPESFKSLLTNTGGISFSINSKKPICMVFDEIDGAPDKSIDLLINFVKSKRKSVAPRPIVCICNNLYAIGLHKLRSSSFVLNVRRPDESQIVALLKKILRNEMPMNRFTSEEWLHSMVKQCDGDIRSAINYLQFEYLSKNDKATSSCSILLSGEYKDKQNSLYQSWNSLISDSALKRKGYIMPFDFVSNIVWHSASVEKLAQAIFENYPKLTTLPEQLRYFQGVQSRLGKMSDFFVFYDFIDQLVRTSQLYNLLYYKSTLLPLATHIFFSGDFSKCRPTFAYPNDFYNVFNRESANREKIKLFLQSAVKRSSKHSSVEWHKEILSYIFYLVDANISTDKDYLITFEDSNKIDKVVKVLQYFDISIKQNVGEKENIYENLILDLDFKTLCFFANENIAQWKLALFSRHSQEKFKNNDLGLSMEAPRQINDETSRKDRRDFFGRVIEKCHTQLSMTNSSRKSSFYFTYKPGQPAYIKRRMKIQDFYS